MCTNVDFTSSHVHFVLLLHWSEVHVARQISQLVEFESSESLIHLHFFQWSLLIGANWHDLALLFDAVDNIAKSILLSKAVTWDQAAVCSSLEANILRVALSINNDSLWLSCEHSLDLFENMGELKLTFLQHAELPGVWLTPEHASLREVFLSV